MKKLILLLIALMVGAGSIGAEAQVIEAKGKMSVKLSYYKRAGCNSSCVAGAIGLAALAGGFTWLVESEPDFPKNVGKKVGIASGVAGGLIVGMNELYGFRDGTEEQEKDTKSTTAQVSMASWGEGKARVNLALDGRNKCGSVQQSFLAVEMASGSYELYSQNAQEELTAVGELFTTDKAVQINFSKELRAKTTGFRGRECWWSIAPNTSISLKR